MIRHRFSRRTRSPLASVVMLLILVLGSLSWSPASAQTEPRNATIEVISLTCDGLITYTYTSDQPIEVVFQFSHERLHWEEPTLIGGAYVELPPAATPQTLEAQGTFHFPIAEANDPIMTVYYAPDYEVVEVVPFPDHCAEEPEPPPTNPDPSDLDALIAQLVALLIAILTSLFP